MDAGDHLGDKDNGEADSREQQQRVVGAEELGAQRGAEMAGEEHPRVDDDQADAQLRRAKAHEGQLKDAGQVGC